jgi:SAM-dependent methyltransferase
LPDATDLSPWLELARSVTTPVLYLGIGAGRLAVPLERSGIRMVGVDAHPGMLEHLARRLARTELISCRLEEFDLQRRFDLVIVPSNILYTQERLGSAAAHLQPAGRLAFELANPHWLQAGEHEGVRVGRIDDSKAHLEIDYLVGERTYTEIADIELVWPERIHDWLAPADLILERMFGQPQYDLTGSPTYFVIARRPPGPGH